MASDPALPTVHQTRTLGVVEFTPVNEDQGRGMGLGTAHRQFWEPQGSRSGSKENVCPELALFLKSHENVAPTTGPGCIRTRLLSCSASPRGLRL